jgi:hypothetical protein
MRDRRFFLKLNGRASFAENDVFFEKIVTKGGKNHLISEK